MGPFTRVLPQDEVIARLRVDIKLWRRSICWLIRKGFPTTSAWERKKRIAIATVLSMHPEVLVLDEPTGGLDPRSRRSLIHLLQELPLTMLVSTHDMRLVDEIFPRMIILDEGRVVADGPTHALMDDYALLEAHGLERP